MSDEEGLFIGLGGGQRQVLTLNRANRHGLIAGATGTGKTVTLQGLAETVLFAEQLGLQRSNFMDIVNETAVGSGVTKLKTPSLINDNYPAAFALDLMLKDILLAADAGAAYPLGKATMLSYKAAQQNGLGKDDVMAIIKNLQNKTNEAIKLLKITFTLEPELKNDAKQFPQLQNLWSNIEFIEITK